MRLRQVNYLVDEAADIGKGSSAIISMLHNCFAHRGLGEKRVHLHTKDWWTCHHSPVPALESDDRSLESHIKIILHFNALQRVIQLVISISVQLRKASYLLL